MKECVDQRKLSEFAESILPALMAGKVDAERIHKECKELFDCENISDKFVTLLPKIHEELEADLLFFLDSDPAANSAEEVRIAYPGFRAICFYRLAHELYVLGLPISARILSEKAHSLTGIDIHPGASIGSPFFIDHGTGIVIGETAVIGKYVKLYQGVTLGALSLARGARMKGEKRHPTVGDRVTIYAGASILGDIKIGSDVTIGSNVFLVEDVPSNTRVMIGKPELIIEKR